MLILLFLKELAVASADSRLHKLSQVLDISLPPLVFVFFLVMMACGYGSVVALTRTVIFEIEGIGPSLAGTAMGIIFTLNRLGGWLIPIAMGGVLDATSILWTPFLLIAALNLIAAILSTRIRETGWRVRAAA